MSAILDAVRTYIDQGGLRVIPIHEKAPAVPKGTKLADWRCSREHAERIWGVPDPPAVAVFCEKVGDRWLVVLDVDDPAAAETLRPALVAETLCETSRSGGLHAFYWSRTETRSAIPLVRDPHIDLKGSGYVVTWPSEGYTRLNELPILDVDNARVHIDTILSAHGIEPPAERATVYETDTDEIPQGGRKGVLLRVAGQMRRAGIRPAWIDTALHRINDKWGRPPLADIEVTELSQYVGEQTPAPSQYGEVYLEEIGPGTTEPPPTPWLIEGFQPAVFIAGLYGDRGSGKSYLAMAMYLCVATGTPFLGLPTERTIPLWIDYELTRDTWLERIWALARGMGFSTLPSGLLYARPGAPFSAVADQIEDEIVTRGVGIAFVDSIGMALAGTDLQSEKDMIPAFRRLEALGIPVVGIDHQAKPQNDTPYSTRSMFGSVYKEIIARTIWQVRKTGGTETDMFCTLDLKKSSFGLWQPEPITLQIAGVDPGARETRIELVRPAGDRLLEELRERGRVTAQELADAVGMKLRTAQDRLKALVDAGTATMEPRASSRSPAVYSIPTEARE